MAHRLTIWALPLAAYRQVIEHVPGDRSVWVDLLTRWAAKTQKPTGRAKITRLHYAPIDTGESEFDWPARASIKASQIAHSSEELRNGFIKEKSMIEDAVRRLWIPSRDDSM